MQKPSFRLFIGNSKEKVTAKPQNRLNR